MKSKLPNIKRPWGGYTILKKTHFFWIKKLFVHQHKRLSLQSHHYRHEVWVVLCGKINVQIGNSYQVATSGDVLYIPKKRKHRITGLTNACVLEIAFGRVLETDIIRYEDDFGRGNSHAAI